MIHDPYTNTILVFIGNFSVRCIDINWWNRQGEESDEN